MKNIIWSISITIIFSLIVFLFWKQEMQYLLPTPLPQNYQEIPIGEKVEFSFHSQLDSTKSTLVHFYNPTCPCSKFNLTHYQELYKQYHNEVNFVFIFHSNEEKLSIEKQLEIKEKVKSISKLTLYDEDKKIAKKCGVYSTPQSVVLTTTQKIFYRGNYNKSRYCTAPNTRFTEQAIKALINNKSLPNFSKQATIAYGCELNK